MKINKYIVEIGAMICKGLDLDQLRKRPVCSCGFKLGDTVAPIPIKQIEETIDRGICEYMDIWMPSKNPGIESRSYPIQ